MIRAFVSSMTGKFVVAIFSLFLTVILTLFFQNKGLQQKIEQQSQAVAILKNHNNSLLSQIALSKKQLENYQRQVVSLNENVEQLKIQSKAREQKIEETLQRNQNWSNQPLPADVKRLFK